MLQEQATLLFVVREGAIDQRQQRYLTHVFRQFAAVIEIIPEQAEGLEGLRHKEPAVTYTAREGKVSALNRAAQKAATPFCMILESDEFCAPSKLPREASPGTCYRAVIDAAGPGDSQRNYQVRLFPTPGPDKTPFDGFSVPDLTRHYQEAGWSMSAEVIPVYKTAPLYDLEEAKAETAQKRSPVMGTFWKAILRSESQQYNEAEQAFREVLRHPQLFEFDRLAALNGLANAQVEQHKLKQAAGTALKSLDSSNHQRAPWLTLYKVHDLAGRPEEAYDSLARYLKSLRHASRANLDVSLPQSDCHYLMAEITFKQGDFDRAFRHYERFYDFNGGEVSLPVLEKLFIYAIELKNYKKSVRYFYDIFGDYLPDNLTDEMSGRLLESLSLFMDNEWYGFVSDRYEELVEQNPSDNALINKWISTLIKNKQVAKAQKILSNKKSV